jgi:hypothetical protein
MSPVKRPSALDSMRHAAAASPAEAPILQVRSDESIGRPEDIGRLVPPSQRPKPPKPTRFTLDLDTDRHRFLKTYAAEIEAKGASQVMRALLDELQADPELAARIRTRVWEEEGS